MSKENKYYVYLHRVVGTNKVFNVGSGCGERMKSTRNRSKFWKEVVNNNLWYYCVVKENMTQKEAQKLEVDLIKLYKPIGNVHQTTIEAKSLELDSEVIRSKYYYDTTSPTYLRYKVGNNQKGSLKRNAGDIAGHLSQARYVVKVNNYNRKVHRVVWFLLNNEDPVGFVIDHIDGDSLNNNINNLRKVTQESNSKNTKSLNKNNLTGYKGVSFNNNIFTANYRLNGKVISKHFSVAKYGRELALSLAVEYRYIRLKELVLSGEPYTERHIGKYKRLPILDKYDDIQINQMLQESLKSNNTTGFKGISFRQYKSKLVVKAEKQTKSGKLHIEFDTNEMGLMPALNAALIWFSKL